MLKKAWEYLTNNIGVYFALFVFVWLLAWTANALWKTGFDLARLEELGKFILGKFGIDSGLNTKLFGKEPKDVTQNG